jgi:hypothetical protein
MLYDSDRPQMETLDKHFRKLTETVFKKHGFAQGDVVSNWALIVGNTLATLSTPERIRWPRGSDERQGGTLHVKAQAGRGLDVQYAAPAIIEKVNQFLGYGAISAIKMTQGGLAAPPDTKPAEATPSSDLIHQLKSVEDPVLKSALARLGAGISAEKPRSPQAKKPVA